MSLARELPRGIGPERLSKPPDPVDRRLHSRLGRRYYRARAGAAHEPKSRSAIRYRSQTGRWIKSRSRICRPRSERRLHAVHRVVRQYYLRGDQSQPPVRYDQGLYADRADQHRSRHPCGASFDRNVQELIALAKSKPGEILYASTGVGTAPHLSGELLSMRAGIKLVHVPYQGSPQAATDLLAGRVTMMFSPASAVISQVEAGSLRALA